MITTETLKRAEQMAAKIRLEPAEQRVKFQSEFSRLLSTMRIEGVPVSRSLQQLDTELCEDAAERQFDNMPV